MENLNPFLMEDEDAPVVVEEPAATPEAAAEEIPPLQETEGVVSAPGCAKIHATTSAGYPELSILLLIAAIAIFFSKARRAKKLREKVRHFVGRFTLALNVIAAVLAYYMFSYPEAFGAGRSGELGIKMAVFFALIAAGAYAISSGAIELQRQRNFLISENAGKAAGIKWFGRGLGLFSVAALLFLILTESPAMYAMLFSLVLAYFYVRVLEGDFPGERLENLDGRKVFTIQLTLLGLASVNPALTALGAIGFFKIGAKDSHA